MTNKHIKLLEEFKKINTSVKVVDAKELVGEPYAHNGLAIKVILSNGNWLRVYRTSSGELNWY